MTVTPPHWMVGAAGALITVEIQLPDFTRAQTTMRADRLGTPEGDAMVRQVVDRWRADREASRDGGPT